MATHNPEIPASPLPGAASPGPDPLAQTLALLQPWIDYVPKRQRQIGLFIFLALIAHVATFFFIRIDTTRAELRHQPRTHVTMENGPTASSEIQSTDNFWDRLTDPRLFILPLQPFAIASADDHSHDFTVINSNIGPSDFPPLAQAGDFQFIRQVIPPLEQRVTATMQPQRQPFSYDETPPAHSTKTTWQWEGPLAQRGPTGVPELPSPISDADLSPTELRIAVNGSGAVKYVLLEQTSQKPELDQQAILAARKIRFQPSDQPGLLWGRSTVFWHYTAKPREEIVPTPPSAP